MSLSLSQNLALLFLLPWQASAAPSHPRTIQSIGYIDPSSDEWSTTLSGVGPLVLLIGERSTKQVLRSIRSLFDAISLATAPLGLLAVVTSLIRFCGIQRLRAYIGYELEARTVVGVEVTRVNCGGVHAHLTDGYVVRSIAANPASQLVAVSILEGGERGVEKEAMERIRRCEQFEREKRKSGIPEGMANSEWVMHISSASIEDEVIKAAVQALAGAVGVRLEGSGLLDFERNLMAKRTEPAEKSGDAEVIEVLPSPTKQRTNSKARKISTASSEVSEGLSDLDLLSTLPTISEKSSSGVKPPFWKFTFMNTFDAVSEFSATIPGSHSSSLAIGAVSFACILGVHVLALWHNNWIISIGWILVIIGYGGIVLGVFSAAMIINSSCVCLKLNDTRNPRMMGSWKDGMVVSDKNTDSMDTKGSVFVTSASPRQNLEAVWIKPSSRKERLTASIVAVSLVLSYVCHYLGLRSIKWWASVGELCVCLFASFARSVSKDHQERFKVCESAVYIDKRCMSTGLIHAQSAKLLTAEQSKHKPRIFDARAYSPKSHGQVPLSGERLAFEVAKILLQEQNISESIMRLTGMVVKVSSERQSPENRAIMAAFNGGVLLSEGIGFPNAQVCLAFSATLSDLAASTGLLARAVMRQPEWRLDHPGLGNGTPLGNVYIFSIQSMMDWWTLSEDRNDMSNLAKNLQWPFFFINVAFFLELLKLEKDTELITELDRAHVVDSSGENERRKARDIVEFLGKEMN